MQMADVTQQVTVQMATEFVDGYTRFQPGEATAAALEVLLDQVVAWASALAPLRSPAALPERIPS
jgi:hypothetical protein